MKAIVPVALMLLLPGCLLFDLDDTPREPAGYSEAELAQNFTQTKTLLLSLADFTGNNLALEIVTAPEKFVFGQVNIDLPRDEGLVVASQTVEEPVPAACVSLFTSYYRSQIVQGIHTPTVMASAGGLDAGVRAQTIDSTLGNEIPFELPATRDGRSTPVVLGVNGALAQHEAGGSVDLELASSEPFWYRLRPGGDFSCKVDIADGEGGQAADLGNVVVARDVTFPFTIDEDNLIGVFIHSDAAYEAALYHNGMVFSDVDADLGEISWHWLGGRAPPGDYVWDVSELQGTNNYVVANTMTAVIVHDLEPWMMLLPWESGPDS